MIMSTEPPLTEQNGASNGDAKDEGNTNVNANPSSGNKSTRSSAKSIKKSIPSPLTSAKSNAAADNRSMRRIIAEDPEWSLATVPLLTELCVNHVVANFSGEYCLKLPVSDNINHIANLQGHARQKYNIKHLIQTETLLKNK